MIETEQQLLDVLHSHGFDFRSTVRDISRRFPQQFEYGERSSAVIPFRLRRPLLGDVWKIPVDRELDNDLPPVRYIHEFHPTRDPRANHDEAEAHFIRMFGPGEAGPAVNVFERHWQVGFFTVRVITWPRELNRRSTNVMEGKNLNLWISANIYVEPDFPFIEPVEDASAPLHVLFEETPGCTLPCNSLVYARRNRVLARTEANVVGLDSGALVLRTLDRTVRVPLSEIQAVKHLRLTPGRYGGSSSIDVETMFLNRHEVNVSIANGAKTDSLDRIAHALAEALGKPLTVQEYSDDG